MEWKVLEVGEEELGTFLGSISSFFCSLVCDSTNLQERKDKYFIFHTNDPVCKVKKLSSALLNNHKRNRSDLKAANICF